MIEKDPINYRGVLCCGNCYNGCGCWCIIYGRKINMFSVCDRYLRNLDNE